jgi:hypothetical protein
MEIEAQTAAPWRFNRLSSVSRREVRLKKTHRQGDKENEPEELTDTTT